MSDETSAPVAHPLDDLPWQSTPPDAPGVWLVRHGPGARPETYEIDEGGWYAWEWRDGWSCSRVVAYARLTALEEQLAGMVEAFARIQRAACVQGTPGDVAARVVQMLEATKRQTEEAGAPCDCAVVAAEVARERLRMANAAETAEGALIYGAESDGARRVVEALAERRRAVAPSTADETRQTHAAEGSQETDR